MGTSEIAPKTQPSGAKSLSYTPIAQRGRRYNPSPSFASDDKFNRPPNLLFVLVIMNLNLNEESWVLGTLSLVVVGWDDFFDLVGHSNQLKGCS